MSDSPIAISVQYSILDSDNIVLKKLHSILHDVGLVKGDISRFFIFLCNFLLCVAIYVFIKNSVHFPQFSVIKLV